MHIIAYLYILYKMQITKRLHNYLQTIRFIRLNMSHEFQKNLQFNFLVIKRFCGSNAISCDQSHVDPTPTATHNHDPGKRLDLNTAVHWALLDYLFTVNETFFNAHETVILLIGFQS